MHPLETLHRTLRAAAILLDSASSQIRDAPLEPVRENILKLGTALAEVFEVQIAIDRAAPELRLGQQYEPVSAEDSEANRRLGQVLLEADNLAQSGNLEKAEAMLLAFAKQEPSAHHAALAGYEATRLRQQSQD